MSLSYPEGLETIPYASFLKITRYEYQEALDKVAKNQNDALGSLKNNKFVSGLVNASVKEVEKLSGSKGATDLLGNDIRTDEVFGGKTIAKIDAWIDNNILRRGDVKDKNGDDVPLDKIMQEKQEALERRKKGLMSEICHLPMPNEFQYSYGANWDNKFKLGTLALLAENPTKALSSLVTIGAIGGAIGFGTSQLSKDKNVQNFNKNNEGVAGNVASGIAGGIKGAANPFNVNSDLNLKNAAGLAGLAPNENAIQMFSRMDMRQFSFTFELAARNKVESDKIITLIEWFKRGMHPATKNGRGSSVLLQFPDVWVIEPKFVPVEAESGKVQKSKQHPMMPKTKLCALTNVQVNTTPLAQFQTIFDGSIPLIQLTLDFQETTALTRMDMEGTTQKKGVLGGNVFRRNNLEDNRPTVTY